MKKISLFTLSLYTVFSFAQNEVNCNYEITDTLKYVESKIIGGNTNVFPMNNTNAYDDGTYTYGYAGYAQAYDVPIQLEVHGLCVYAFVNAAIGDSAWMYLYESNVDGFPVSKLDSVHVLVPGIPGYTGNSNNEALKVCGVFNNSHTINAKYAIGIENLDTSLMGVGVTSNGASLNEGVSFTYYSGDIDPQFDGWYKMDEFNPSGWKVDAFINPIVSYEINVTHSTDTIENCVGDTTYLSASVDSNGAFLAHKMYNPNQATYNSVEDITVVDLGDGATALGQEYVYADCGTYVLTPGLSFTGWNGSQAAGTCILDQIVNCLPLTVVDTTICDTTTYFAGGANQSSDGVYYDTIAGVQCDTVIQTNLTFITCPSVDVVENGIKVSIYPNPAQRLLNITSNTNFVNAEILSLDGRLISKESIQGNTIDLSNLDNGTYFVKLISAKGNVVSKIQVAK